jgi:protein involved in polysaccharide export with SLBB domain
MLLSKENFRKKIAIVLLMLYLTLDFSTLALRVQAKDLPQDVINRSNITSSENKDFVEGNALEISVFPDTTSFLTNIYPIDGNGNIFLPILGKVKVTTMNKNNFRNYLIENYMEYLKFPNIQVRPLIRVSVLGGVQRPGLYYVDPSLSFWHVLQIAGGTIDEDGIKKMKWERNKQAINDNLIPLLQSGQSLEQIGFKSGDQVWIPTPNKPTFWDKIGRFSTVVSLGLSVYTIYYFSQSGRRYSY